MLVVLCAGRELFTATEGERLAEAGICEGVAGLGRRTGRGGEFYGEKRGVVAACCGKGIGADLRVG